jgi:hypothetical protein
MYKLDLMFGPVGSSFGFFLFLAGIALLFYSWMGIALILSGAFFAFSYTGCLVNPSKKRLRYVNVIFGIIPIGSAIYIEQEMKFGLRKSDRLYRAYSRTNRVLDIKEHDYRIYLYDPQNKEIMPVRKCKNEEKAFSEAKRLADLFEIGLL